jgi:hypothetical protein
MQYTNFRVRRETYQKLRKLRNKLKVESVDKAINFLLEFYERTKS